MCVVFFLLLLGMGSAIAADEVELANGDRLSGDIVEKSGDRLVIRTEYAGDVAVRWSAVVSVSMERALPTLVGNSRDPVRGRLHSRLDGSVDLAKESGETVELGLADVAFLNPKPYETTNGVERKGRALLSAAITQGNSDSVRLYGEGELTARARMYRYSLNGRIERREEPVAGITASNWLLGANYDRFRDQKQFGYVRGSLENDRMKDIDRRATAGGGYGRQLVETPRANVSVRGGLDYVVLERIFGRDERYPAAGWGIKANYKPLDTRMELFHSQDGYWNLQDTEAITFRSKSGLRTPLVEKVNGVAQLNLDWERKPAPGLKPTDATLLLGVDYAW